MSITFYVLYNYEKYDSFHFSLYYYFGMAIEGIIYSVVLLFIINGAGVFNNDIIEYIIENFTHKEQGVRNLKRCIETIISKVNMYELLYNKNKIFFGFYKLLRKFFY